MGECELRSLHWIGAELEGGIESGLEGRVGSGLEGWVAPGSGVWTGCGVEGSRSVGFTDEAGTCGCWWSDAAKGRTRTCIFNLLFTR